MTKRTKNGVIIGGTSIASAALAMLIVMRFTPPDSAVEQTSSANTEYAAVTPGELVHGTTSSSSSSTAEPAVFEQPAVTTDDTSSAPPDEVIVVEPIKHTPSSTTAAPTKPKEETSKPPASTKIEYSSYTIIEQNFTEAVKDSTPPTELPADSTETTPPASTAKPTQPAAPTTKPSQTTPKNGDTKNGKIYIEGFGWVTDHGGGASGTTDNQMYRNGNKVGTFG